MTMNLRPHLKKIIGVSLFLAACTQVDVSGLDPDIFTNAGDGGNGGATNDLCKDVDSTFSTKVIGVFNSKCNNSGCHGTNSEGGGLNLDDNDNRKGDGKSGVIGNIKFEGAVNAFSAAQSSLLLKPLATAEGGQGGAHTGGEIFANTVDPDYKTLFCWIDAGAKNDLDDSQCTFGEHVYPVFRERTCTNCHQGATPSGNLNFTQSSVQLLTNNPAGSFNFTNSTSAPIAIGNDITSLILTKPSETNGVTHSGNNIFATTTDPDYQTIKCWLEEGAQNN